MGALLAAVLPLIIKAAEDGTLEAIVSDVIALAQWAIANPQKIEAAIDVARSLSPRPAPVESPAMEHAAGPEHGGR